MRRSRIRVVLFLAVALISGLAANTAISAAASSDTKALGHALTEFNAGDYAAARPDLTALAQRGIVEAQFFLGVMHLRGLGTPPDIEVARSWLRRAGEQNHAAAQFELGEIFRRGIGVPPNPDEAARWYGRAAEGGWFGAQMALAGMYAAGDGVLQDPVEALKWYDIAAEMGLDPYNGDRDRLAATMDTHAIAEAARRTRAWLAAHRRWDNEAIADTAAMGRK